MTHDLRLGVNIDHVATIRNARGGRHPDPVRAARLAAEAGADGITAHLREDRRHISDTDIHRLKDEIDLPLNLEMAATAEMLDIALATRPPKVCLVPEKRQELTTEGGLDAAALHAALEPYIGRLHGAGIRVSLFVDPDRVQIAVAEALGADVVELHTGPYCDAEGGRREAELDRLKAAAREVLARGLECHAGHGLSFDTVGPIAAMVEVSELNIGHFLVGEAIFGGLESSIRRMRAIMDKARAEASGKRSA
ncbi:MAG TPA: pyridoxine 5'-phosphate synthase [Alphaproteobacteria bacterium]